MRHHTLRRRASLITVLACAGSPFAGCGSVADAAKDRAQILSVLRDWEAVAHKDDAHAVCALLTARARAAQVTISRRDYPEDGATTCEQAAASTFDHDWVEIALLHPVRWSDITVDGDRATARADQGVHTRLMRVDGRWRIDGPKEMHEEAASKADR